MASYPNAKDKDAEHSESVPEADTSPTQTELSQRLERLGEWRGRFLDATRIDERLVLLVEFGLTDYDIAKAVPNAKARSIRRWRTESPPLTQIAEKWEPIDDICALIGFLLSDGSYDEEGIIAWLRSRQPELHNQRPLDVLGTGDFDAVRAAAEQMLVSVHVEERELLAVPRPPVFAGLPVRRRLT